MEEVNQKEDLMKTVELSLKKNINMLQLVENQKKSVETNENLQECMVDFQDSIKKIQAVFMKTQLLHEKLNPSYYQQIEINQMKEELSRKDMLIKDQMRKLAGYRSQIEIIKEAQDEAMTMSEAKHKQSFADLFQNSCS